MKETPGTHLLNQDSNVLSSSNQQCFTSSSDAVSGWFYMTFAVILQVWPLLCFFPFSETDLNVLSPWEKKKPDE